MTDPDGTLARIDAAVEAWELGPDAYRWDGEAEAGDSSLLDPELFMVLWPPPEPALTDETRQLLADAPTDAALALLVPASCGKEHAVVLTARSGVGNSSGVHESAETLPGRPEPTSRLPGASQPNRDPQESP